MVRKALGDDAVILRTRKVKRGGLLSFLSKEMVEVVAASPDRNQITEVPVTDRASMMKRGLDAHPSTEVIRDLREEISELKGSVKELAEQVKFERMPSLPHHVAEYYKILVRSGLQEKFAKEIAQELNLRLKGDELENGALVQSEIKKMVASLIRVRQPKMDAKGKAKIIALIGPTGVGKTTTLAKLVTSYRFWGKSDTALVSADTYRVAAIEQLKTFAAIAGLPMEAVYQPGAMQNTLSRHLSRDAIFIDTAGRSQADTERLGELADFLKTAEPDEVFLCLAVATRFEEQLDIIERYKNLHPTGIIFTKLDESRGPGTIINVLNSTSLPMVYLTCGQNVPDDIVLAKPKRIIDLILNSEDLGNLHRSHFEHWITDDNTQMRQRMKVDK